MELEIHIGDVIDSTLFFCVDLLGTVAFALSGITIARSEGYSIFGAMVLAWLPAFAGGLAMDVIAGRQPPAILAQPVHMIAIIASVLVARAFLWLVDHVKGRWLFFFDLVQWYLGMVRRLRPMTLLTVFDAVGMAGFTVAGVMTAIQFHCHPYWLWGPTFAAMNAALGTILRDVFRADASNPILKGSFYAEIAVGWGLVLVGMLSMLPAAYDGVAVMITIAGVLVTRLWVYRAGIRAPMF